jgi:hypothetical protein
MVGLKQSMDRQFNKLEPGPRALPIPVVKQPGPDLMPGRAYPQEMKTIVVYRAGAGLV